MPASSSERPGVCVVIAAHDLRRWRHTRAAVRSVLEQDVEAHCVVVVDHNPGLLERCRRQWPHVTVLPNRYEQGASGSRNTGVEVGDADLVAFLDDDAVARPGWLSALVQAMEDPAAVGAGGMILADWEIAAPRWFPPEFNWAVGATVPDLVGGTSPLPRVVRNVWSGNMILRRDAFERIGGFRLGFGKVGERSRPEDTDLCLRAAAESGGHWLFAPDAVVDHHVPASRATFRFFVTRAYREGGGKIAMSRVLGRAPVLPEERDYMVKVIPLGLRRAMSQARHGEASAMLRAACLVTGSAAAGVGAAVEHLRGWSDRPERATRPPAPGVPPTPPSVPTPASRKG